MQAISANESATSGCLSQSSTTLVISGFQRNGENFDNAIGFDKFKNFDFRIPLFEPSTRWIYPLAPPQFVSCIDLCQPGA